MVRVTEQKNISAILPLVFNSLKLLGSASSEIQDDADEPCRMGPLCPVPHRQMLIPFSLDEMIFRSSFREI